VTISTRDGCLRLLTITAALLVLVTATAGAAGAGAVGGPEYGIVRVDTGGPNHGGAQQLIPRGHAIAEDHRAAVDACLREHGWLYGSQALQRTELRVGHPNGLSGICSEHVGREAVHTSVERRTRHA
jgi:hypothetical protein